PRVRRALVERHRDHHEATSPELLVERLPHGQVESAPSPGGIRDEEDLLTPVLGERVQAAREVGQREVGRLQRGERAGALPRGDAEIRRSEEHTSELQSLRHLVCRLLLEKKNPKTLPARTAS